MVGNIFVLTIFIVVISYTTARPNWGGNPNHLLSENDYIDENTGRYQGNADHLLSENDYIDEKPMKLRHRRMIANRYTTVQPNWGGNPNHLLSENNYIDENTGRIQGNEHHLLSENDYIDEKPMKLRHRRMIANRYTTVQPNWGGNPNHLLSENNYIDENTGRIQGNAHHLLSENDYIDEKPMKLRHRRMITNRYSTVQPNWQGNPKHLLSENDYIDENTGRYQGNADHLLSENDYIDEKPMKLRHRRMIANRYTTVQPNWRGNPNHLLSENDYIDENTGRFEGNADHLLSENDYIDEKPMKLRHRREVETNPDGIKNVKVKYPLAAGEKNVLSAVGDLSRVNTDNKNFKSASGGLELDNINGHKLSLTGEHTPNVGNEVTAAGKMQILNNNHHDLSANAFATRDMPSNPALPSTNTFGGGLDYNFDKKNSLSLSGVHTPTGNEVAAAGKMEILHNNRHDLTANAFATRSMPTNPALSVSDTIGGGLDYTFDKKNTLSLAGKHISDVGSEIKASGNMNLFHNDNHDLFANAFGARTMPSNPAKPPFNTFGGGLDYTYRDKIGASLDVLHTPLRQQTDFSALSHVNLYRNPTTTLDFNARVSKSFSPFMPRSSWEPYGGLIFKKYF